MELWIHASESVASGMLVVISVTVATIALWLYARIKGVTLFEKRP